MFKIVNKDRYRALEKIEEMQDNYIEQIRIKNAEVAELKAEKREIIELFEEKHHDNKKLIARIGGLTASNNHKIKENKFLMDQSNKLKEELFELKNQLAFYKKYGKSNEKFEKSKNYIEMRKECERRAKISE